jgi:hypothetical protein
VLTETWLPHSFLWEIEPHCQPPPFRRYSASVGRSCITRLLFRALPTSILRLNPAAPPHLASPPLSPPRLPAASIKERQSARGRSHTSPEGGGRLLAWPRPRRRIRAGNLERMRGDGLRAGPLASCCEEPSPRVAAAWIQLCARRKNRTKNRSRLLHPLTSEHAVAAGSRGRAEQRHRDVAGQSIVALEGAMVTRHGRTEAVKSAADGIRPDAPGEGDQATGEHSHDGKACVAVGLPVASASAWPSTARSRARGLVRLPSKHLRWSLDSRRRR